MNTSKPYNDQQTEQIIGAAIHVHKALGNGFLEVFYQEAFEKTLIKHNIPYVREKALPIYFDGEVLKSHYIADFECFGNIIVELKVTADLTGVHESILLNYLKAAKRSRGLLLNFGKPTLQIKRRVF